MYCGPDCMVFVAAQLGESLSSDDAARLAGTTAAGTNPWAIARVFRALGYPAQVRTNLTWWELHQLAGTHWVIVDWWSEFYPVGGEPEPADGHYSVVLDVFGERLTLMDPDSPTPRTMSRAAFEAHWYDEYVNRKGEREDLICAAVVIVRSKERKTYAEPTE